MLPFIKKLLGTYERTTSKVSVNSKSILPTSLPRANPRAFDYFEQFLSNSPLCWQLRRSNAPPVRNSESVKFTTLFTTILKNMQSRSIVGERNHSVDGSKTYFGDFADQCTNNVYGDEIKCGKCRLM